MESEARWEVLWSGFRPSWGPLAPLDRTADAAQKRADRGAEDNQSSDGKYGDEGDDEAVLDQTLGIFMT